MPQASFLFLFIRLVQLYRSSFFHHIRVTIMDAMVSPLALRQVAPGSTQETDQMLQSVEMPSWGSQKAHQHFPESGCRLPARHRQYDAEHGTASGHGRAGPCHTSKGLVENAEQETGCFFLQLQITWKPSICMQAPMEVRYRGYPSGCRHASVAGRVCIYRSGRNGALALANAVTAGFRICF